MKNKIYRRLAFILSLSMVFSVCTPVMAAEGATEIVQESAEENTMDAIVEKNIWKGDVKENNRVYLDENGEKVIGLQKIEDKVYFFDEEGIAQTGWQKVDGVEYYFSPETGERYENRVEEIDGIQYSFNEGGEYKIVEEEVVLPEIAPEEDIETEIIPEDAVDVEQETEKSIEESVPKVKTGWITDGENKYFADQNGVLYRNQIITFGNTWYYMGADGSVQKGYIKAANGSLYYGDPETGMLKKSSWVELEGKRYYANERAELYKNQIITFGNTWYCMGQDGSVQKGIVEINGKLYNVDETSGKVIRKAQWVEKSGKRYYTNSDGVLYRNQVITFGSTWYCMGKDGSVQKGIVEVNGKLYYTDETTGQVIKKAQWIEQNGKRYFVTAEGKLYQNQIITFGNTWYYMGADGSVQKGIVSNKGTYYFADSESGIIRKQAGWIEYHGKKYYSQKTGVLYKNQFISFNETYYYCGSDAAIVTGKQVVGGVIYNFDSNGIMKKEGGWGEYNGNKYYKNPATGFPYKNQWVTFGQTWYYANVNGFMVSGWQTIKGYRYYFYPSTKVMARNTTIDGIRIGADGKAVFYSDRMAVFSTVSTNNANGTYNMKRAVSSFNQVIIQPGQTLSFFGVAGPCGQAEGYLPAGVVGGVGYGGGICQASTTLYGAALRAGLTIVERRNHSVPSTYVPIGQDAMVDYGSSDLKIKNNYDFPVKLVTYSYGNTLYVEVWGMQPSWYDYVNIESWYTSGNSAVAYRKYIKNGNIVRVEQLPSSFYY